MNRGQRVNLTRLLESMFGGSDEPGTPDADNSPQHSRPSRERIRQIAQQMAKESVARETAGLDVFGEPLSPEPLETAPRRPHGHRRPRRSNC